MNNPASFFAIVPNAIDALRCYNQPGCFGSNCFSKGGPILNKNKTKLLEPYTLSVEEVVFLSLFGNERFYYCNTSTNTALLILSSNEIFDNEGFDFVPLTSFELIKKIVQIYPFQGNFYKQTNSFEFRTCSCLCLCSF